MPLTWLSPLGGEGGTSCRQPFPGHPGLSQPCSQRRLSGRCASTVLSRNDANSAGPERSLKLLFSTTFSPSESVNNLGINWLTGYSQARRQDSGGECPGSHGLNRGHVYLNRAY